MLLLENIKIKCIRKHISVAALEREVGFSNGTIGKWENSSPKIDKLQKVADYFGCTVDELLAPYEVVVSDES